MVESYNERSNRNMRRPIVKEEVVDFMRTKQKQLTGHLGELADFARQENIPIIPHETVVYFQLLLQTLQPEKILEVGTAIGFSALLMKDSSPKSQIVTIDRNPEMIALAKENFSKYDPEGSIRLLEGDAQEVLPTIEEKFDLVFMDSAKSKYIEFLPYVLDRLNVGGLVIIDDIFQAGDVVRPIEDIRRGQRTIHRGLNKLFDATLNHDKLTASLLPISDGILMIRKNDEDIDLKID
ncbi:O-methyltransferase [Streptococcaceae bacterium ESL0687]|nr:O-methyltransferase [Streptococcaceae bacterium ESL0687]